MKNQLMQYVRCPHCGQRLDCSYCLVFEQQPKIMIYARCKKCTFRQQSIVPFDDLVHFYLTGRKIFHKLAINPPKSAYKKRSSKERRRGRKNDPMARLEY